MQLYPPIRNRLPTKIIRSFNGVNKLDSFSISENQASDMQNCSVSISEYPALTLRPGYSLVGTALAAKILGLGTWKNSELNAISNGEWFSYVSGTWTSRATGLSVSSNWSFANFKGGFSVINLLGANGVDPVKTYDGTTVSNLTDAPAGGNYVEQFADRVWLAVGNDLHFCEYRVATNWTVTAGNDTDPGSITIETNNGETISAIKSGIGKLTIFKPNSIHKLMGYAPSDYQMTPITFDVGAINNQCVVTVQGMMYFLHPTGFYRYPGGTLPERKFSLPIQNYMDRINSAQISKCSIGTDGQNVYISIPLDSATDPDTIIEYLPDYGIFNVWKGYASLNMVEQNNVLYTGETNGQVRQVRGLATDNGTAITWNWDSKVFGGGSYSQILIWKRAWIVVDVDTGSTLNIYLSKTAEGSDWTLVQSVTASNVLASTRIIIPTSTLANANFVRLRLSGTGTFRVKEIVIDEDQKPIV